MNPRWMTLPEAAERLGVSRTRVWRMVRSKTLPAKRIGDGIRWLIDRDDFANWVLRNVVAGGAMVAGTDETSETVLREDEQTSTLAPACPPPTRKAS